MEGGCEGLQYGLRRKLTISTYNMKPFKNNLFEVIINAMQDQ